MVFFYFVGGFISLLVAGSQAINVLYVLAWLNVLTLPYTLFSVYYQWKVARQWCVLCLTVQGILLAESITYVTTNLFSLSPDHLHLPAFLLSSVITLLSSFLLPAIILFFIKPLLLQTRMRHVRNVNF